jgi:hypothetical protein
MTQMKKAIAADEKLCVFQAKFGFHLRHRRSKSASSAFPLL